MKTENKILELSFDFSLQIIELFKEMRKQMSLLFQRSFCGVQPALDQCRGSHCSSNKRDFIAKMAIASKEARETRYWLRLLDKSKFVPLDYSFYLT